MLNFILNDSKEYFFIPDAPESLVSSICLLLGEFSQAQDECPVKLMIMMISNQFYYSKIPLFSSEYLLSFPELLS